MSLDELEKLANNVARVYTDSSPLLVPADEILRLVAIARAADSASIFFESYSSLNEVGQSRLESECEDVLAALREALEAGRASIEGAEK